MANKEQGGVVQRMDGVEYRLAAPYDFDFLKKYGRVFHVFDDQDSGNICFGLEKEGVRRFVKFAGAPTLRGAGTPAQAVERLKACLPVYQNLRHRCLTPLLEAEEIGGGFAMVFPWASGDCMGRMYPKAHRRFMALSTEARQRVFLDVLDFLQAVNAQGYVAVDFYDGSILYDFESGQTTVCDIDFFRRKPCVNDMGRMWGSSKFQAPEEYRLGVAMDERTNVYTAGAMAFALFANYQRDPGAWQLDERRLAAAFRAISTDPAARQESVGKLREEWEHGALQNHL